MHYCIGDVHGCFDELMSMLNRIEEQDAEARFVLLGDLMDRGPKSFEVLTWAMDHVTPGGKYQTVMGNHEDLILEWYRFRFTPWYKKGKIGLLPRSKFDFCQIAEERNMLSPEALDPIMDFLKSLPTHIEIPVTRADGTEHLFIATHAWHDRNVNNALYIKKMNLRQRNFKGQPDPNHTVVFGHTPTGDAGFTAEAESGHEPGKIAFLPGAVNIDGGCCFGTLDGYQGNLCGLCLETGEEWYEEKRRSV